MGFLSKIRNNMRKKVSRMPRRPGMIGDMRFRGRMPRRGGFGFGLGEAIRRLNEQQRMMPQPIPRAEIDISALDPLPMGDMPMTQDLPEVAPVGMMAGRTLQQDFPAEPRMMMQEGEEVSLERELFSLQTQLENLEEQLRLDRSYNDDQAVINTSAEMAAIQKRIQEILQESGRTISDLERQQIGRRTMSDMDKGSVMSDLDMSRPQLAGGGDFPDLTGDGKVTQADILKGRGVQLKAEGDEVILSIDQKINNELKARGYPMDVIADLTAREKLNDVMRKNQNLLSPKEIAAYASSNRQDFSQSYIPKPVMGLTRKYAEGGEIDAMLGGMGSEVEGAMESMEDLEQMAPEMEMIDQLVTMVVQMIQQGASEEEVIMFLREQGLDDEDIGTVLQLVAEMAEAEAMPQDGIGAELEQLA
tara:strand:- start:150 stop:1400 length:1251 start_codon:yes stop_codon:yes gene_type:complete